MKIIVGCAIINDMKLKIKRLSDKVQLPKYAHDGDACFDLCVFMDEEFLPMMVVDGKFLTFGEGDFSGKCDSSYSNVHVGISPNQTVVFHTGLKFETDKGYNMKVHVRSSTGIKKHLILSNCTGVIDTATYRGEVLIALTNIGDDIADISNGERVAQAEIVKTLDVEIEEVSELSDTVRGEGGFGSTGGH